MNTAQVTHRRGFDRFLAILSGFALFASLMVMFAPAALAHHPEITAGQVCANGLARITYESVSWKTDGGPGSGHSDIRIEVRANGSGNWVEVGSGAFDAGNDYRFSGSFDAAPYFGDSIQVRARSVGSWDNGSAGGQTTATGAFVVNLTCTQSAGVSANPQACAVNPQGGAEGAVSFDVAPASGATVQVYTNANFTGPVGGALGDGDTLGLSPGTYFWRATAAGGYTVANPSSGQFDIAPCSASVVVVAGVCAVNANGAPVGTVQVTIDPDAGASVVITGPGGPYNFSGAGGSAGLAPGSYGWQATAGRGFTLTGPGSGSFDIDPCGGSVSVDASVCTVANGTLGSIAVTIDPESAAKVLVYSDDAMTNLVATFTGDGGNASLAPGTYYWSASAEGGFALTGDTTGSFTIAPCSSSVTVITDPCAVNTSANTLGSVHVVIDPNSGANVVVTGTGGPYNFSGGGGSHALAPGSYTWAATPGPGFSLTGDTSGSFSIAPCQATVAVTGTCVVDGSTGNGLISVVVSDPGSMTVEILHGATSVGSLTSSGTVIVPEGETYAWMATPSSGFAVTGADEGTVDIATCRPDEVLGEVIENDDPGDEADDLEVLPFTGIDTEALLVVSLALLGSGWTLVRSARRLVKS